MIRSVRERAEWVLLGTLLREGASFTAFPGLCSGGGAAASTLNLSCSAFLSPSWNSLGLCSILRTFSARLSTLRILSNDSSPCFSNCNICRPAKRSAADNSPCDRNNWSIRDKADFSLSIVPQYGQRGCSWGGCAATWVCLRRFDDFLPILLLGCGHNAGT